MMRRLAGDLRRLVDGRDRPVFREYATAVQLRGRKMRIEHVEHLTRDAVALTLADVMGAPFAFVPGEFVTLVVRVAGVDHRRAYSICSAPGERGTVQIGVKRVAGGIVSTHLCELARAGDIFEVFGPSGAFTVRTDPALKRELVLIGGGSGVTPLLSIARAVLAVETASRVALVFANRSAADIMFARELASLVESSRGRFVVRHVLEAAGSDSNVRSGRLNREVLAAELDVMAFEGGEVEYYVCGPEGMMDETRRALADRGVASDRVRFERFTRAARRAGAPPTQTHPVIIRNGARELRASAVTDQTLLEVGLAAGAPMAFSCTMGGCGTCRVRIVSGHVEMDEPNCLLPMERSAGYALACIARACSPVTLDLPVTAKPGGPR